MGWTIPLAKAAGVAAVGAFASKKIAGKPAAVQTPAAPQLDEAAKNTDQLDRIKRRRGVLANVFGGATKATAQAGPTPGVKQLLGE
jgi:hypothetical protein